MTQGSGFVKDFLQDQAKFIFLKKRSIFYLTTKKKDDILVSRHSAPGTSLALQVDFRNLNFLFREFN
jgi:hypothetical protein